MQAINELRCVPVEIHAGRIERKKKDNFPETIQFVRESSRHSQGNNARIRGRDSRQQKRYTENQRTLDEAFRQRHVFIYTHQKPLLHSHRSAPSPRVPSIHHILSLHSPHSIMWRIAMNQRRRYLWKRFVNFVRSRCKRRGETRRGQTAREKRRKASRG